MSWRRGIYIVFASLAALYIGLLLVIPPDSAALSKYALSSSQARLIGLTVVLPYILIWSIAVFAYTRFKDYALRIKDSPESKGLSKIADGLLALAIWMPASSIVANITTYIFRLHPNMTNEMIIISNYFNLILVFFAIFLIHRGSMLLINASSKPVELGGNGRNVLLVFYIFFGTLYVYTTLTNPARTNPSAETPLAAYYLPDLLLGLTIIVPYLIMWYLGITAAYNIYVYRKHSKGVLYRQSLRWLALGLGVTIISLMILRYLSSLTTFFSGASLRSVLGLLYALLLLIGIGYIFIALGAKKLQRLEDI